MTNDEMIRRLQTQFGNIGGINAHTLTGEERSNRMDEGTYNTYGLGNPALMRQTEFGEGLSNVRPGTFSPNRDPLATEYGIIPSEQTATPTSYRADLTAPDQEGYYYTADYTPEGTMVGSPKREQYKPDFMRKHGFELGLALVGGAALLPMLAGAAGAGGVTAASLGELGLNTALAAGTPGGIASGLSAASLGELGINTALAAGSEGGIAAGTALSGAEAAPSFFESLNLGKTAFPNAPSYVQQGVNRFGTGLITSGGDPEAAAKSALMGGLSDFGNIALADLPPEVRQLVTTGARTALQGGDLESVLKSTAFGTLSGNVTQAITGATGSKWAGEVASNAIKQALTSGNIDPRSLSASTLAQLAGRAVGAETGNEYLGRAATTAVLGAIKGKDLEDIVKQMAMGALNTPTKKG